MSAPSSSSSQLLPQEDKEDVSPTAVASPRVEAAAAVKKKTLEDPEASLSSSRISLDEVLSTIGIGYFQDRLWWICGFGFTAAAIEVVVMAFLLPAIRDDWKLNEYQIGMVPTVVGIGSILGELFCSTVADRFGRRWVFWATTSMVAVFGVASAFSPNAAWLCTLRVVVGFGYGGNIAVDFPMYVEFLPTSERNSRLFQMQVLWPLGQVFTCLFAWLTIPRLSVDIGWRAFLVLCALPSIVSACFRAFVPESPRWLLLNGRSIEATAICREIAIVNGKVPEEVGLTEGVQLHLENEVSTGSGGQPGGHGNASTTAARRNKGVLPLALQLLSPTLIKTTLGILMFAMSLHTASYGINTLMPTLLERKGIPQTEMNFTMTLNAAAGVPGIMLAMVAANTYGRLLPIRLSLLLCGIAIGLLANATHQWSIICASCMGSMCLEASWSLFHVYIPEAYPTELRATAVGVLSAVSAILSSWVPLVSAYILEAESTLYVVLFFAVSCVIGAIGACLWLHVETLGRALQDRVGATSEMTGPA